MTTTPSTETPPQKESASTSRKPDLSVRFAGISFKNPVLAAAGTFGYGIEFEDIVTLEKLGGFVTKGLSREPIVGNPPPRLFETAAGMLNSIGLQNIGARAFIEEKLPRLAKKKNVVVIANVFGYTREDYLETIHILNDAEGITAYELNVSCPNTHEGGMVFGTNRTMLEELVANCKSAARRPLIVKLTPNVTSIPAMAKAAENAGADALSVVNTFVGMAIDAKTRKPRISNITAGLSGPAIKPIALRMVYEAAHTVDIPVIGMGGISTAEDVVEFMLAGAAATQVGTANFWDPCATEKIIDGLQRWCVEHRVKRVTDLIGALEV
jgi:dihydroorotate dehydrogenase (NAD+) catalytic subunit